MGILRSGGSARAAGNGYTGAKGEINLIATDGWIALPDPRNPTKYFPDSYAPNNRTTYLFGFRDVTSMVQSARTTTGNPQLIANDVAAIRAQKGKIQASAPLIYVDENDDVTISLSNLGFQQRPDLTDGHTIHWHGFRNALSLFDGIPEMSISVPIGRTFPYFYKPHNPGTYIYHCHFEDVEHVQMGMTGVVFVRPAQNKTPIAGHPGPYAYNDGDGSTAYDREFALLITEWYLQSHWEDAHIQHPTGRSSRPTPGSSTAVPTRTRSSRAAATTPTAARSGSPIRGSRTSRSRPSSRATPASGCWCGSSTSATSSTRSRCRGCP